MPKEAEIRKALGLVVGRDLASGVGDDVVARDHLAVWVREVHAVVTSRDIGSTGEASKTCGGDFALDVGGTSRTDSIGTVKFNLTDYVCQPPARRTFEFGRPINFVATPQADTAIFLTSIQTLLMLRVGGGFSEVAITVHSWDSSGSPAGDVSFDWRCFVPATEREPTPVE